MDGVFDKLVFVVGCPRSGTTKLTEILANHPQVFCSSETHFFNTNWGFVALSSEFYDAINEITEEQLHELLGNFYEHYRIKDFFQIIGLETRDFTSSLQKHLADKYNSEHIKQISSQAFKKALFETLMHLIKNKFPCKTVFCEKTPQHLQNVWEIWELFPSAKIIHIERDGRDVVNSLLKMPWRPRGLINNARFWRRYVRLGNDLKRKVIGTSFEENFISIKFEDLVLKPEKVLEHLSNFLDMSLSASMLENSNNLEQDSKIFADWEKQWKHKASLKLDPSRVGIYKKELKDDEQVILNDFLRKDLESLSYEADLSGFKLKHQLFICMSYLGLMLARLKRFFATDA